MIVDLSNIDDNPFRACADLREAFKPQPIKRGYGYIRISAKGQFNLVDYDAGVYWVKIYSAGYYGDAGPHPSKDAINYCILFTVGNLDDCMWQAWSQYMPKEKCDSLVDRLKTEILDDLSVMPTDKELNELLEPFGLYGEYTS